NLNGTPGIANGTFGDDKINVSPVGLSATVTTINVVGGDSTNGDNVVVNGGSGINDIFGYKPTRPDNGSLTPTGSAANFVTTTEAGGVNGEGAAAGGGDTLTVTTPAGVDQATFTPGAAVDAGSVAFTTPGQVINSSLTPLAFSNLGSTAASSVTFADAAARSD